MTSRAEGHAVPSGSTGAAVAMVLGGSFSIQFGGAFAATAFPRAGPLGTVTIRLVVAGVLLAAVLRPRLRGRTRTDVLVAVAFGLVLAAMNACFYQALARLPIGVAVTFEFLGPLGVALATSRRWTDVLWVVAAGAGVALLSGRSPGGLDPVGVVFALGAAACWALYILLSAQTGRRFPRADGLALAMLVGAVAILPAGIVAAGTRLLDPHALLLGALVALLSSVIPYTLELFALRRLPPGTFGILMSLEPAIAAVAGVLVLGQLLGGWQIVAIGLVVVASVGVTVQTARRGRRRPPPSEHVP